MKTRKVLHC